MFSPKQTAGYKIMIQPYLLTVFPKITLYVLPVRYAPSIIFSVLFRTQAHGITYDNSDKRYLTKYLMTGMFKILLVYTDYSLRSTVYIYVVKQGLVNNISFLLFIVLPPGMFLFIH